MLAGLKRRGFAGRKQAAGKELVPSAQNTVVDVLGRPMASVAEGFSDVFAVEPDGPSLHFAASL